MKSTSLSQLAYLVREVDGEFIFTTDAGETYSAYLTDGEGYAQEASFANQIKMFGFERLIETTPETRPGAGSDKRTMATLCEILTRLLSAFPDLVIVYVCSRNRARHRKTDRSVPTEETSEERAKRIFFEEKLARRLQQRRAIIFANWFSHWQQQDLFPVIKIDYALYGQLYTSCLFRQGHPKETEIRQTISNIIVDKQPTDL